MSSISLQIPPSSNVPSGQRSVHLSSITLPSIQSTTFNLINKEIVNQLKKVLDYSKVPFRNIKEKKNLFILIPILSRLNFLEAF